MKTIILYDPNWHGHHPTYLKLITEFLLKSEYVVWLICHNTDKIRTWLASRHNFESLDRLVCMDIPVQIRKLSISWVYWGLRSWLYTYIYIKALLRKTGYKPDLVFFCKLDDLTAGLVPSFLIDLFFRYSWTGIYIHLGHPFHKSHYSKLLLLFNPLRVLKSKYFKGLSCFQEDCVRKLQHFLKKPVFQIPDFTDESLPQRKELAKNILKRAKGRKIIGLIGGQDRRKGSFLLLKIAKQCVDKNWFFVFAGRMNYSRSDRELSRLKSLIVDEKLFENCYFFFHRIQDEAEFNGLLSICDLIFAVYHDFPYSSNILTKAALVKKPVLVTDGTLMAKRVKRFKMGDCCRQGDINSCIEGISKLLKKGTNDAKFDEYLREHSIYRFSQQLEAIINLV